MKGDLHTLKKMCLYGSKVMLAGTLVLAAIIAALLVLGAGSLVSDGISGILEDILGMDFGEESATKVASSYLEMLIIFVLALVTVFTTYKVMRSIHDEHSPFTETNVLRVKRLSFVFLFGAVLLLVMEALKDGWASMTFMFFGCILLSVVLYMFALMIRYGGLLQDESDRTL